MKTFAIPNLKFSVLLILFCFLFSCQNEETIIVEEPNPDQKISANSPLSNLISRVTQNPTSSDNFLDKSSCVKVNLPVNVFVNGNLITVGGSNGMSYSEVENLIESFPTAPSVIMDFPISISHKNYSTEQITSQSQMNNVISNCSSDSSFNEIDCVAIVYPITVNLYNTTSQQATTLTIQNNVQLFGFVTTTLSSTLLASINYPVYVSNPNGQTVAINSNSQLQDFIENAIGDCDDSPSNGGNNPNFITVLTSGNWKISYYFDETNQTSSYSGYAFAFTTAGTVTATKNNATTNGSWTTYLDSGKNKLDLLFDGTTLDTFEEDWQILEYNQTMIVLKNVSGGNGGIDYLTFTKN